MLSYKFDWSVITSGQYHDWLVSGLKVTLQLSLAGIILSFLLGLIVAVMRMSHLKLFRWSACVFLEFTRNTPLLVQIFFWYFGSYKLLPTAVNDWLNNTGFEFAAGADCPDHLYIGLYCRGYPLRRSLHPERADGGGPEAAASPTSAPCSTSSCPRRCG